MPTLGSGVPRIVAAMTTASPETGLAVLSSRQTLPLWEVCAAALRELDLPAVCVIDPFRLRLYITTEASIKGTIAAWLAANDDRFHKSAPEAAGLLAKWNEVSSNDWPDLSTYFHPVNRRTLAQVLRMYLVAANVFTVINQDTGEVTAICPADSEPPSDDLADITPTGETLCFHQTDKNTNRLIFE